MGLGENDYIPQDKLDALHTELFNYRRAMTIREKLEFKEKHPNLSDQDAEALRVSFQATNRKLQPLKSVDQDPVGAYEGGLIMRQSEYSRYRLQSALSAPPPSAFELIGDTIGKTKELAWYLLTGNQLDPRLRQLDRAMGGVAETGLLFMPNRSQPVKPSGPNQGFTDQTDPHILILNRPAFGNPLDNNRIASRQGFAAPLPPPTSRFGTGATIASGSEDTVRIRLSPQLYYTPSGTPAENSGTRGVMQSPTDSPGRGFISAPASQWSPTLGIRPQQLPRVRLEPPTVQGPKSYEVARSGDNVSPPNALQLPQLTLPGANVTRFRPRPANDIFSPPSEAQSRELGNTGTYDEQARPLQLLPGGRTADRTVSMAQGGQMPWIFQRQGG